MMRILLFVVLLTTTNSARSAKILAMLPFSGGSHTIFFSSILKPLAYKGHTIVEYSSSKPKYHLPNHTQYNLNNSYVKGFGNMEDFLQFCTNSAPRIGIFFPEVWSMNRDICEETFKHEAIEKLLKSKEHFDLVLTESSFGQESMVVFGHKFQAPVITLQTFHPWSVLNRHAGNALSIATLPQFKSVVATDRMTILERLKNFLSVIFTLYSYYHDHLSFHEGLIKDNYKQDTPPLVDMLNNVSLYLVNTHPAVTYPQPFTPNIIPVGGITISPESLNLSQDIKRFLDEATDGFIYFSLGTMVPAHLLPPEILQIFVNVFKNLKQNVLWRINLREIPGLPGNVMLKDQWIPQPAVLAHPNCVLFLTHGGWLSQQEAMYSGVPTVGMAFFADQPFNVKFSEHIGVGIKLDFHSLSESSLSSALMAVMNNPKYKDNAMKMSRIFQDQPMTPTDTVVFWVEYVLRHGGAPHLTPVSNQLSWYQLALIDVVLVLLTVTLAGLIILLLVFKRALRFLFPPKKALSRSTKNKRS